jgi:hypothetical protein
MNKKGHKDNLKAKHQANFNAGKAGVHSPRRRAEEAEKVRESLARDPERFLIEDEAVMYADLRGLSKLLEVDLAERGVSDRTGKQRRQAGTYLRTLHACLDLSDRIQARKAATQLEDEMENPWTEAEAVERLCEIARNRSEPPAARIAAIKFLHELAPAAQKSYDQEFFDQLEEMSPEQLAKEVTALLIPVTTGIRPPRQEWAEEMVRRFAKLPEITEDNLRDLYDALKDELDLD